MRTLVPPAPVPAPERALEPRVREIGRRIAAGQANAGRSRTRVLEDRGMELLSRDPALKAALFRLVDVAPACSGPRDVAAHLASLLGEVERPLAPIRRAAGRPVSGRLAGLAVQRMAKRFIVGEGPQDAVKALRTLWDSGAAASVDLLGEATVTAAEADRYARRCDEALRTLAGALRGWPRREILERDAHGAIPRVNLSVKVTALTARVRAEAPELGIEDAADRLRGLLGALEVVDDHLGPRCRERLGVRAAEPAGRTRDDRDLPVEPHA
jgi:RHH-type proline utilization regulon transcriptional repressor/proline dehydrogenase/delta 1-pyrroline-5-carboxylate dehydrogenase